MRPFLKFIGDFFASKRILGEDNELGSFAKIDGLLNRLINDRRVPGISISVLKSNRILFQKGYGYADIASGQPVDPNKSLFRIGSVSKPIAATALAKMSEEGVIDLDASFYDYVPYYPKKEYDFSIRQLASHTAGIRTYKGKEYALNIPQTIKESITLFQDDPLLFEPGHGYLYNTFDWVLISLAMQEASGIPFEKYVSTKVLAPLQMQNTLTELPKTPPEDLVSFYTKTAMGFKKAAAVDNRWKLAGGGYISTSADIVKLGRAYLDKQLLAPATSAEFLSGQNYDNTPTWYGLGWEVSKDAYGRPFYGHTGNGVGVHARFCIYPEEALVISILINCTNPGVEKELNLVIENFNMLS